MVYLHNGMLCIREEKEASALRGSMDGTGELYAKWNKADSERQIPYDLTYKWNLINKTKEHAKYHQRHWNKEQTDSNQGVEGGRYQGKQGEGPSRNMHKGHMDKAKGGRRVGGGDGWGGGHCGVKMEKTLLEQQ